MSPQLFETVGPLQDVPFFPLTPETKYKPFLLGEGQRGDRDQHCLVNGRLYKRRPTRITLGTAQLRETEAETVLGMLDRKPEGQGRHRVERNAVNDTYPRWVWMGRLRGLCWEEAGKIGRKTLSSAMLSSELGLAEQKMGWGAGVGGEARWIRVAVICMATCTS